MTCSMFKRGHENEGAGQDLGSIGGGGIGKIILLCDERKHGGGGGSFQNNF